MTMNRVKIGGFLVMAAISGASAAAENVAQANISAIYQPAVPAAVVGIPAADGISLLDGKIPELRDPSRVADSVAGAPEGALERGEMAARSSDVAREKIRRIYTATSAD